MVSSGKWVQLFYMLEIFHKKMLERNEQECTASDPLLSYTGKGDWEPGSGRVRILQVSPSSWGHYGEQRPWAEVCSSGSCKRRQNSACPVGDWNMFLKTCQTNLNPSRNEGRWERKAWGRRWKLPRPGRTPRTRARQEPTVLILLLEDPWMIFLIQLNPTNPQI